MEYITENKFTFNHFTLIQYMTVTIPKLMKYKMKHSVTSFYHNCLELSV